jgi:hypothetical protein
MKACLLICSVVFICTGAFAQNKVCDRVYNKYAGKEGFITVNLPGSALKNIFFHDLKDDEFKIASLRMLLKNDSVENTQINFYQEIVPKLNKDEYKELVSTRQKNQDFIILCKEKKDKIVEFILVSGGRNNMLVNFAGEISLSDMNKISQSLTHNDTLKEFE